MKLHWTAAAASTLVSSSSTASSDDTGPIWRRVRRQQGSLAGHNYRKVLLSEEVANAFLPDHQSLEEPNADIDFPIQHLAPDENEDSSTGSSSQHVTSSWFLGKYGLLKNSRGVKGAPCNPYPSSLSNDPDVGILACDTGLVCEENPNQDGNFQCVDDNQSWETTRHSRILDDNEENCDYSEFDGGSDTGTVVCTYTGLCGEEYNNGLPEGTCARNINAVVYDPENYPTSIYGVSECLRCIIVYQGEYDTKGENTELCLDISNYYRSGDLTGDCTVSINGKACRSCSFDYRGDGQEQDGCSFDIDCGNTCWGSSTGDICSDDFDLSPALNCFGDGDGGGDDGSGDVGGDGDGDGDDGSDDRDDGAFGSFHGTTLSSSLALAGVAAGAFAAWF